MRSTSKKYSQVFAHHRDIHRIYDCLASAVRADPYVREDKYADVFEKLVPMEVFNGGCWDSDLSLGTPGIFNVQ